MSPTVAPAPARTRPADREALRGARPALRLVGEGELNRRDRRRRTRLVGIGVAVLLAASLLGMAAFHAVIVESQVQLARLEQQVTDEQARFQRLRLRVAELESPERVVAAAQERLGMVPPPGVVYLSPTGPAGGVAPVADVAPPGDSPPGGVQAWATVKPHLGNQP